MEETTAATTPLLRPTLPTLVSICLKQVQDNVTTLDLSGCTEDVISVREFWMIITPNAPRLRNFFLIWGTSRTLALLTRTIVSENYRCFGGEERSDGSKPAQASYQLGRWPQSLRWVLGKIMFSLLPRPIRTIPSSRNLSYTLYQISLNRLINPSP